MMKKYLFIALAAAAMTSCSQDDTLDVVQGEAIKFGNVLVDNATRAAEYTAASEISEFKVYGDITLTGTTTTATLYNGAEVKKENSAWTCTDTQYWLPSCSYNFTAVVDGSINNGSISYNMGDGDLLLAKATATTDENAAPSQNPVAFTFGHLLSKTYFTFTNGTEAKDKYTYQVTSISVTNYASSGTFNVSNETWSETLGTLSTTPLTYTVNSNVAAEQVSSTANLLVPGAQNLSITIAYNVLFDGKVFYSTSTTKPLNHTFVKNYVYNIGVTLPAPGDEIKFTVTDQLGWGTSSDVNL